MHDAARRLATRRFSPHTGRQFDAIDLAAAAVAAGVDPAAVDAAVTAALGRAEAVMFAAGACLSHPEARGAVVPSLDAVEPWLRPAAIASIGSVLAAVDLGWAWSVVEPELRRSGAGVIVGLLAEYTGLTAELPAPTAAVVPAFRALAAAARGEPAPPEPGQPPPASESLAALDDRLMRVAAAGLRDPRVALATIGTDPSTVDELEEAIVVIARELVARGDAEALIDWVAGIETPATRAVAIVIAVEAGAVDAVRARPLIADAIRRVDDFADGDGVAHDGFPLLSALVRIGDVEAARDQAVAWRMHPAMYAALLHGTGDPARVAASLDAGAIDRLLELEPSEWACERDGSWQRDWWDDAVERGDDRRQRCVDVALLAGWRPASPLPSSVAGVVDLLRRRG
jgi:hypothetical protein